MASWIDLIWPVSSGIGGVLGVLSFFNTRRSQKFQEADFWMRDARQLRDDVSDLHTKLESAQTDRGDLHQDFDILHGKFGELRDRHTDLRDRYIELRASAENEQQALGRLAARQQVRIDELEDKIEISNQELERTKRSLADAASALAAAHQQVLTPMPGTETNTTGRLLKDP